MLRWVVSFLLIAIVAGILGFTNIAIVATNIAQIIFVIFLVLFIATLFLYLTGMRLSMMTWLLVFLVISIIAGLFGFTTLAVASVQMAKIICFIFLVLFIVSLVLHINRQSKWRQINKKCPPGMQQ